MLIPASKRNAIPLVNFVHMHNLGLTTTDGDMSSSVDSSSVGDRNQRRGGRRIGLGAQEGYTYHRYNTCKHTGPNGDLSHTSGSGINRGARFAL